MQTYNVRLEAPVSKSFRCQMAANSLDIDSEKKSIHELNIEADLESPFNVGLIVGASGSGKTTLARQIFGERCFDPFLDGGKPVIDQFPENLSYDDCASLLAGVGLTSVPCWIRPVYTLSNGQRARAEAAIAMTNNADITAIDEWTSVVDRTVAKVMSHCVQKFARKNAKKVILLSCHYDVAEWLDPDWIIDCNSAKFIDRRSLHETERRRTDKIKFDIRECSRESWRYFSKYHYLSDGLPGGKLFLYGLYHGQNQIGFQCFANYVPQRPGHRVIFHSNRTVIHPDYAGLGLGIHLINETSHLMKQTGYKIMAKFSSTPIYRSMSKNPEWKLCNITNQIGAQKVSGRVAHTNNRPMPGVGVRKNVKTYSFEYVGRRGKVSDGA